MLNVPMLKLEKNNTYLTTQLEQQENNKQLILNIIANINLILSNPNTKDLKNYESILDSANGYLSSISDNITTLERLSIEILTISKELEDLQSDKNKATKSKEFFIKAFSNIKDNIAQYTAKFQNAQKKLEADNNNFNEFINVNNFKYNFETVVNEEGVDSETYKFTGFCIDNQESDVQDEVSEIVNTEADILEENIVLDEENTIESLTENTETIIENVEENTENTETNQKIDELTNNFRKMLIDLSNNDSKPENASELISSYFQEISQLSPNTINEELKDLENEVEIYEETQNLETDVKTYEEVNEDLNIQENDVPENIADYSIYTEGENIDDIGEEINNYYKIPNIENNLTEVVIKDEIISDVQEELGNTETNIENSVEVEDNNIGTSEKVLTDTTNIQDKTSEEVITNDADVKDETLEVNNSLDNDIEVPETITRHKIQIGEYESSYVNNGFGYDLGSNFTNNIAFSNNNNTNIIDESVIQEELLKNKLKKIITAAADNETLIISEKTNKIYLPYKIAELVNYIDNYPNVYSSLSDVVEQEFILPFDYFMKHPYKSRFFETYNLIRNRQGRSPISALGYGLKLIHKTNLNPAIIASCKNEEELKNYIYYLDSNRLNEFKAFNIIYQVNPL